MFLVIFQLILLVSCNPISEKNNHSSELTVQTKLGILQGSYSSHKRTRKFLGIPYAEPPLGDKRFMAPSPPKSWIGTRKAIKKPLPCFQFDASASTEDCLYLNVWSPTFKRVGNASLPVVVFLFGGAFILGSGDHHGLYSGENVVSEKDVVVVTLNYRLGPFGFLVTDSFRGNQGIEDQRMALIWIKENIHFFGGDANRVTLMGQSAGAFSVAVHLTSPLSKGLFSKAILMSAPLPVLSRSFVQAKKYGMELVDATGCSKSDNVTRCMQSISAWQILTSCSWTDFSLDENRRLLDLLVWIPVIDGKNILAPPFEMIQQKRFHPVPLIIGTNRDELFLIQGFRYFFEFWYSFRKHMFTEELYCQLISRTFGEHDNSVLAMYPVSKSPEHNYHQMLVLLTDYLFHCPAQATVKQFQSMNVSSYLYSFDYIPNYIMFGPCSKNRVCHAVELPLIFKNVLHPEFLRMMPAHDWLINSLSFNIGSFVFSFSDNFIHQFLSDTIVGFSYGDINKFNDKFKWPHYNSHQKMSITVPPHLEPNGNICDHWNSIGYTY